MPVYFDPAVIDPDNERATDPGVLVSANYPALARAAADGCTRCRSQLTKPPPRKLGRLVSDGSRTQLRDLVAADPAIIGTTRTVTLLASADVDSANKGHIDLGVARVQPQDFRPAAGLDRSASKAAGQLTTRFNWGLLTFGASSRAETAGLGGALIGSFYMMPSCSCWRCRSASPRPSISRNSRKKNRLTDLIEVNINNLAAVPSIVFGLLGLAVFINFFGLPRSAPLVGGLVLTLMTLPTIIIATRAALRSVPPSIRSAALGIGASKTQMVFHHVLPVASPGILTATIIGVAHALGETAPLLLIGMIAFVADAPTTPLDQATALPVQIYLWPTSGTGLCRTHLRRHHRAARLLALMNLAAIFLRRRFERRW